MSKRLYIAGAMRGHPEYNFPAFDAAASRLRAQGYEVVNPAEMSREVGVENVESDPAVFNRLIAEELREVRACDAIYLLQGWENSLGTRDELEVAISHGLEIMLEPPQYHVKSIRCGLRSGKGVSVDSVKHAQIYQLADNQSDRQELNHEQTRNN